MLVIAYARKYGATKEVAKHIADLGHPVVVILGSGIYHGAWLPEATTLQPGESVQEQATLVLLKRRHQRERQL